MYSASLRLLPSLSSQVYRTITQQNLFRLYHRQLKVNPVYQTSHRYIYNNDQTVYCTKCEAKLSAAILCDKCGAISDIDTNQNYFQLLQIDPKYNIDPKAMTQSFRRLQSVVHPDKFGNKSSEEQTKSAEWSSLLNKAYATLSHPLKRGEYMLRLEGVEIPEKNEAVNPEFLMEIMEKNEKVAEFSTKEEIDKYLDSIQEELKGFYEQLGKSLESRDFNKALDVLTMIRYFNNLEKKLKEKQYTL